MDDFGVNIARSEYTKATARAEAAEADARECRAERASYGDAMTEKLAAVEADRNALRKQLALVILDYQDRLAGAFMDTGQVVMERDALRDEAAELQAERDEIIEALDEYGWWMDNTDMLQRLKFALAVSQEKSDDLANMQLAARECRAERARYGDAMTARLADVEAERDALRERCIEWLPFNEAAETIDSILVWREDAGVFVAFYADEQECWFTSFGEDLTGDLPAFYAKMPKGPDNKRPALQKDGLR